MAQALEDRAPLARFDLAFRPEPFILKLSANAARYAAVTRALAPLPSVPFPIAVPASCEDPRGGCSNRRKRSPIMRKARNRLRAGTSHHCNWHATGSLPGQARAPEG